MKTKITTTDRLVNDLTAFRTWAEMLDCLRGGYVPTLTHSRSGSKLANIVEAHGFRVYMPRSGQARRR